MLCVDSAQYIIQFDIHNGMTSLSKRKYLVTLCYINVYRSTNRDNSTTLWVSERFYITRNFGNIFKTQHFSVKYRTPLDEKKNAFRTSVGKSAGNELLESLGRRAKCQCKSGSQTNAL